MDCKNSVFNKNLLCCTLKKYSLASVVFFLILLFITQNLIDYKLIRPEYYKEIAEMNETSNWNEFFNILFIHMLFLIISILAALVLFKHFPKVCKIEVTPDKASFISIFTAAVVLVFTPAILNGIIFTIAAAHYNWTVFVSDNMLNWIFTYLSVIFLVFSCAVFSVCVTGNTTASLVVNCSFCFSIFICNVVTANDSGATLQGIVILFAIAIFFIVMSYIIYKKTSGKLNGINIINEVIKYIWLSVITVTTFYTVQKLIYSNPLLFILIMLVIVSVSYIISELILKTDFRIFSAYKGYITFVGIVSAIIVITSAVNIYNHKSSVPKSSEVEKTLIYGDYYGDSGYHSEKEIIDMVIKTHSELTTVKNLANIYDKSIYTGDYMPFTVKYKLKNGEFIEKDYPIKIDTFLELQEKIKKYE